MKVTVNRTEISIFRGARVADALRQYYSRHKKAIPKVLPEVEDKYGNKMAHDGKLTEGSIIIIIKK